MVSQEAPFIRLLHARFDLPLSPPEIVRWRGALSEVAGAEFDLFHNHKKDGSVKYRYPVIQYRISKGNAALLAVNDGIEELQAFLSSRTWQIKWNGEPRPLLIEQIAPTKVRLLKTTDFHTYRIQNWMALNQENYHKWGALDSLADQLIQLEGILAGHLLGMASGLGWTIPSRFTVRIKELEKIKKIKFKGVPIVVFDVLFQTDLLLPDHLAAGKSVSHGFGVLFRKKGGVGNK